MSNPLQFSLDGGSLDAEEAVDVLSTDLPDNVSSSDGSLDAHTDSEGHEDEPDDVRSFSHGFILQTALQKNQSDPHFNPAHSKIHQPASILNDPPVSSLGGTGTAASAAADDKAHMRLSERVLQSSLRSEQQRYNEELFAPQPLSDENITAGRWIGNCPKHVM